MGLLGIFSKTEMKKIKVVSEVVTALNLPLLLALWLNIKPLDSLYNCSFSRESVVFKKRN